MSTPLEFNMWHKKKWAVYSIGKIPRIASNDKVFFSISTSGQITIGVDCASTADADHWNGVTCTVVAGDRYTVTGKTNKTLTNPEVGFTITNSLVGTKTELTCRLDLDLKPDTGVGACWIAEEAP